jgi:hypothetical protein
MSCARFCPQTGLRTFHCVYLFQSYFKRDANELPILNIRFASDVNRGAPVTV